MDADNSTNKKTGMMFLIVGIGIFLCNLVMLLLLINANNKLEEHNKIVLSVPPELKEQIIALCQRTADDIKIANVTTINNAFLQIKEISEKNFTEQSKSFSDLLSNVKKLAELQYSIHGKDFTALLTHLQKTADDKLAGQESAIRSQLQVLAGKTATIAETTAQNQRILTSIANERTAKADAYLKAARSSTKNPEIAQILYISALSYSSDKVPILKEFIDWQGQFIISAIKENNIELARERLLALASICDANISTGSIDDMAAIPLLKQKLSSFETQILKRASENIAEQQENLNKIVQRIETLSSYEEAEQLLNELTQMTCDVSLNKQKDAIVARIIQKQSCLTTPAQPLMLPAINPETPWVAWLGNFVARLKSDLPIIKKLEDIGTAAELLQAAKQSSVDGVDVKIAEIENASRNIYLAYWQERVDRVIVSSEPNVNDISALLSECNTFKKEEQAQNVDRIVKLNKLISLATLKELEEGLKNLKRTEEMVSSETFMQMVGATQSQYMQVLLRLQALQEKYPGNFTNEISDVSQKIAYLGQLISSYKNKLIAGDLKKAEAQRERFIDWARAQLERAQEYDNEGEEIASKWNKTRSSEEAVAKYENAWQTLMSIHPGDLSVADPALYQTYNERKTLIENHWIPNDDQRSRIQYKRITDF